MVDCPLFRSEIAPTNRQCIDDKCAWYDKDEDRCCILTIAKALDDLARSQTSIESKTADMG